MAVSKKSKTLQFDLEKETPGTFRYAERVPDDGEPVIGSLYVKKTAAKTLGNPTSLTVTVSAA